MLQHIIGGNRIGSWMLAAGVLLGGVPVALAAEEAHGEKLSLFAGNLGNAIWTLLIFILVVVVLGKFAWGPLLTGLQKREKFIRDSLEAAKRDREAAEARLKEYEEQLTRAREEASSIVEEGRRDSEEVKKRIESDARKHADDMIERARREINVARDTALRDLYDQASQLAMEMAGTVLKRQLNEEDHQRLVQETLAELQRRNSQN